MDRKTLDAGLSVAFWVAGSLAVVLSLMLLLSLFTYEQSFDIALGNFGSLLAGTLGVSVTAGAGLLMSKSLELLQKSGDSLR